MGLLDFIFKRKKEPEEKPSLTPEIEIPIPETETSLTAETETSLTAETEILNKLDILSISLRQHDKRLATHDSRLIQYMVELMVSRRQIPKERKGEIEVLLKDSIDKGLSKQEVVSKLTKIGVPRSSAYKYAKDISPSLIVETENLIDENETG